MVVNEVFLVEVWWQMVAVKHIIFDKMVVNGGKLRKNIKIL